MRAPEKKKSYLSRIRCCLRVSRDSSCGMPRMQRGSVARCRVFDFAAFRAYLKLGVDGGLHGLKPGDVCHSCSLPGHTLVSGVLPQSSTRTTKSVKASKKTTGRLESTAVNTNPASNMKNKNGSAPHTQNSFVVCNRSKIKGYAIDARSGI